MSTPIYEGTLKNTSDERTEIIFWPSIPRWAWSLLAGGLFCGLWRFTATGGTELHLVAAGVWGLAVSSAFSVMQYGSLRDAGLIVPRRRLVLQRAQTGTYRGAPEFCAEVDGVPLPSSTRRGLFVIRHPQLVADVVVIGEAAIVLQRFTPRYARPEEGAASVALLRAERTSDREPLALSVPPVHAVCRVLDLTPHQTGGDVSSSDLAKANRRPEPPPLRSAFDRWGPLVFALHFVVPVAWSTTVWTLVLPELRRLDGWLAALLVVAILVAPMVPVFRWIRRVFYAQPLQARTRVMIARANDGPGLAPRGKTS